MIFGVSDKTLEMHVVAVLVNSIVGNFEVRNYYGKSGRG